MLHTIRFLCEFLCGCKSYDKYDVKNYDKYDVKNYEHNVYDIKNHDNNGNYDILCHKYRNYDVVENFFEDLIYNIKSNNDLDNLLELIITPFYPYFLCDHFVGTEPKKYNITVPNNINDILASKNIQINDFDIIHVQVDFFLFFVNKILPKIDKKIILMTGQWQWPQIDKSTTTDDLLNNSKILLWISQNPIYSNHPKYVAFPYGMRHSSLKSYAKVLTNNLNTSKYYNITQLHLGKTNDCRAKLPSVPGISADKFYKKILESKFVVSPIGDRNDCYRHYECIGLGTIPISNVGEQYKTLFENNMYYCTIDEMISMIKTNNINYDYRAPNKNLICAKYYKHKIFKIIENLKISNCQ